MSNKLFRAELKVYFRIAFIFLCYMSVVVAGCLFCSVNNLSLKYAHCIG